MSDTTPSNAHTKSGSSYRSRMHFGLLYLAFTFSGAAGLIYEVMWARSFSLIFGSTAQAAAAVLAAFFAGLGVGGLLAGYFTRHRHRAVLGYAATEIVVIVTALAVNLWLLLFQSWYPALYRSSLGGPGTMIAVKLALAFVALGPPSIAMGVTLPLMARALVSTPGHLGRRVSLAYGLNTLGATLGVLLAGFVLPPLLGTGNTIFLAAGLNLCAAAFAIAHWRLFAQRPANKIDACSSVENRGVATPDAARSPRLLVAVVVISGFGTLALEVIYTRLIINFTDSSVFSFAMMLSAFLVSLAAASLVVSALIDRLKDPWRLLAWTQTGGTLMILASPLCLQFALRFRTPSYADSLSAYLFQLSAITIVTTGPAILLIGTALPTAWKIATREAAEAGQRVGRLTGFNTLAGVVGSITAGFVMIPILGISNSVIAIAALYAALSVALWRLTRPDRWLLAAMTLVAVFTTHSILGISAGKQLRVSRGQEVIYYHEGEAANVAVLQGRDGVRLIKVNNRYTLGTSLPDAIDLQRAQGGLPLLMHSDPQRVAFVGIATGVSVSSVLEFPAARVVAIELIQGVVDAAESFRQVNRGVLEDSRVEVLVADGRNHLSATNEFFDVIVADLFVPWHAGTGYLYTREHIASVSRRLAAGGIFAQWLPAHQLSVEELRIITGTFLDVFEDAEMWINQTMDGMPVIALLGYADGRPGRARRALVESNQEFPGLEFVVEGEGLRQWASSAPRNTDEFPLIEFASAASHYRKGARSVSGVLRTVERLGDLR